MGHRHPAGQDVALGELLAVAHPDCQPQLKEEAKRLYGWGF